MTRTASGPAGSHADACNARRDRRLAPISRISRYYNMWVHPEVTLAGLGAAESTTSRCSTCCRAANASSCPTYRHLNRSAACVRRADHTDRRTKPIVEAVAAALNSAVIVINCGLACASPRHGAITILERAGWTPLGRVARRTIASVPSVTVWVPRLLLKSVPVKPGSAALTSAAAATLASLVGSIARKTGPEFVSSPPPALCITCPDEYGAASLEQPARRFALKSLVRAGDQGNSHGPKYHRSL
jgi:hypothetical protein